MKESGRACPSSACARPAPLRALPRAPAAARWTSEIREALERVSPSGHPSRGLVDALRGGAFCCGGCAGVWVSFSESLRERTQRESAPKGRTQRPASPCLPSSHSTPSTRARSSRPLQRAYAGAICLPHSGLSFFDDLGKKKSQVFLELWIQDRETGERALAARRSPPEVAQPERTARGLRGLQRHPRGKAGPRDGGSGRCPFRFKATSAVLHYWVFLPQAKNSKLKTSQRFLLKQCTARPLSSL